MKHRSTLKMIVLGASILLVPLRASAYWSDELTTHMWDATDLDAQGSADCAGAKTNGITTPGRPSGGWFEWRFMGASMALPKFISLAGADPTRLCPRTFNEYTTNHHHGVSSARLATSGTEVFAAYDSRGGYYHRNGIKVQQNPVAGVLPQTLSGTPSSDGGVMSAYTASTTGTVANRRPYAIVDLVRNYRNYVSADPGSGDFQSFSSVQCSASNTNGQAFDPAWAVNSGATHEQQNCAPPGFIDTADPDIDVMPGGNATVAWVERYVEYTDLASGQKGIGAFALTPSELTTAYTWFPFRRFGVHVASIPEADLAGGQTKTPSQTGSAAAVSFLTGTKDPMTASDPSGGGGELGLNINTSGLNTQALSPRVTTLKVSAGVFHPVVAWAEVWFENVVSPPGQASRYAPSAGAHGPLQVKRHDGTQWLTVGGTSALGDVCNVQEVTSGRASGRKSTFTGTHDIDKLRVGAGATSDSPIVVMTKWTSGQPCGLVVRAWNGTTWTTSGDLRVDPTKEASWPRITLRNNVPYVTWIERRDDLSATAADLSGTVYVRKLRNQTGDVTAAWDLLYANSDSSVFSQKYEGDVAPTASQYTASCTATPTYSAGAQHYTTGAAQQCNFTASTWASTSFNSGFHIEARVQTGTSGSSVGSFALLAGDGSVANAFVLIGPTGVQAINGTGSVVSLATGLDNSTAFHTYRLTRVPGELGYRLQRDEVELPLVPASNVSVKQFVYGDTGSALWGTAHVDFVRWTAVTGGWQTLTNESQGGLRVRGPSIAVTDLAGAVTTGDDGEAVYVSVLENEPGDLALADAAEGAWGATVWKCLTKRSSSGAFTCAGNPQLYTDKKVDRNSVDNVKVYRQSGHLGVAWGKAHVTTPAGTFPAASTDQLTEFVADTGEALPGSSDLVVASAATVNDRGQISDLFLSFPGPIQDHRAYDNGLHVREDESLIADRRLVAVGSNHSLYATFRSSVVFTWGSNLDGQLGRSTTASVPTAVSIGGPIVKLAAGANHSAALRSDGTLFLWGDNANGELCNLTLTDQATPQANPKGWQWADVGLGNNVTVAVRADGTVWSCGKGNFGQIGDNSSSAANRTDWVQVRTAAGVALTNAQSVSAGNAHGCALMSDRTVWCWGNNAEGQLGGATAVGVTSYGAVNVPGIGDVAELSVGSSHNIVLTTQGLMYGWGDNNTYNQLGTGDSVDRNGVVLLASALGGKRIKKVFATLLNTYAMTDVGLYAAGGDTYGGTGVGSTVANLSTFSLLATSALKNAGSGSQGYHQLVLGVSGSDLNTLTAYCFGRADSSECAASGSGSLMTPVVITGLP